jgi:hypothetical protein
MEAHPPQVQHPHRIMDIFKGIEERVFGPEGRRVVQQLQENQIWLENFWELPKESFTIDGNLAAVTTTDSPRGKFRIGGRAVEIEGTLRDAGLTDTEFELYVEGVLAGTLTIPAGETLATTKINYPISRNNVFYIDLTQAGSSATGLVGYIHMVPDLKSRIS